MFLCYLQFSFRHKKVMRSDRAIEATDEGHLLVAAAQHHFYLRVSSRYLDVC
jgi:hypothetical protein